MSALDANRNLLFGILALQMDFIDREQLVAAVSVWLLNKERLLEDILLEQHAFSDADRQLLGPLVDHHIANHDGDADKSLASLSSVGEVVQALRSLNDCQLEATLSVLSGTRRDGQPEERRDEQTDVSTGERTKPGAIRYRVLRPHARGGLGEVSIAEDTELNREVALKLIQPQLADDESSRARFVLEAEVTGGLEHPGIVPVYGLGQYSDGRPFYAMRFIHGDSLKQAADRFHHPEPSSEGATEAVDFHSVTFRNLLGRFVDVCNAIAYAHSRGVLHRDLKPGNIMLGKYGETLVVDWGLAKLKGRDDDVSGGEATLRPRSGSGSAPTEMGSAVGTPAYMSPEQAVGRLNELGPASDVYSLGATLYCLLTGQPPIQAESLATTLTKVQHGEIPPPRQINAKIPRALEAICRQAMALRIQDRYATPRELADEVERWLGDRPVSAYRDPPWVRLQRWGRQHRAIAASLGVLAITTIVALAGFVIILSDANRRIAHHAAQSEESFRKARSAVDEFFTTVSEDKLLNVPGLQPLRKSLLQSAADYYEGFVEKHPERGLLKSDLSSAYTRLATITQETGSKEKALDLFQQGLALQEQVVRELPSDLNQQHNLGTIMAKIGLLYYQTGASTKALRSLDQSLEVLDALVKAKPSRAESRNAYAGACAHRGAVGTMLGEGEAALPALRKAASLQDELVKEFPEVARYRSQQAMIYTNLGVLLKNLQDYTGAQQAYEKCVAILERLIRDDPYVIEYRDLLAGNFSNLGNVQRLQENREGALVAYQRSLQVRQQLSAENPHVTVYLVNYAKSLNNLGGYQDQLGHYEEAEPYLRQAFEIRIQVARERPEAVEYVVSVSKSLQNLMVLYSKSGKTAEIIPVFDQARDVLLRIATDAKAHRLMPAGLRYELGENLLKVGQLLGQAGRTEDSLEAYEHGIAIIESLSPEDLIPIRLMNLATGHNLVAGLHFSRDDYDLAMESGNKAVAAFERLAAANPNRMDLQIRLAAGLCNLGQYLRAGGQPQRAVQSFDRSIELLGQSVQNDVGGAQARMFLRNAYHGRATTYDQMSEYARAADDWGRAAAAHEQYRMAHLMRQCESLARGGQYDEAVELVKTLLQDDGAITFASAKIYTLAAQAVEQDQTISSEKRIDMVGTYVAAAKRLLDQTKELDALDQEHLEQLETHPDFEMVRRSESFHAWFEELSGEVK